MMRELEDSLILFVISLEHVRAELADPAFVNMQSGPHSVIFKFHLPPKVDCVNDLFIQILKRKAIPVLDIEDVGFLRGA